MIEQTVSIERMEDAIDIFGSFDENIRIIEQELAVRVVSRDDQLKISGEEDEAVDQAAKVIQGLLSLSARGETIHEQNVRYLIQLVKSGNEDKIQTLAADVLCVTAKGKPVKAKTVGQKRYVDAIRNNTITLGVGPAGTGKTYLAVAARDGGLPGQGGQPHHPHPPGGGGGGAAGLPPRGSAEQGGPLPPAPSTTPSLRCWGRRATTSTWNGAILRWPPGLHAGRTLDDSFIILDGPRTPPGSR